MVAAYVKRILQEMENLSKQDAEPTFHRNRMKNVTCREEGGREHW